MTVEARPLEWHDLFGGGWTVDCTKCGDVWTQTTNDPEDLPLLQANAEAAAVLHADLNHARIMPDEDGTPTSAD